MRALISRIAANIKSHAIMWLCCTVMIIPLFSFLLFNRSDFDVVELAFQASPLLLCIGAHLVLHKFMGKSCHSETKTSNNDDVLQKNE